MDMHPLFAGFHGVDAYAVGAALGFAIHVEVVRGPLPIELSPAERGRIAARVGLDGFHFAGGWGAPGVHCLMFAKPLTRNAATWWQTGAPCVVEACALAGVSSLNHTHG